MDAILSYLGTREWSFVEVLVVDDGSTDGTAEVVRRYREDNPVVRLLSNPGNRGKGYAVRHGMLEAAGEWRLFSDADLSAPIEDFDKIFAAAREQHADGAIGSRAVDRSLVAVHQSPFREYAGRFFNVVMRCVTRLPFRDTQCGFKVFHRRAAQEIFSRQLLDGFGFDVEDLFLARKLGFRILEVPVRWSHVEGTKVTMLHGLDAFMDLLRIRWNHLSGKYQFQVSEKHGRRGV